MHRIFQSLLPSVVGMLLLASCHSLPKHARFIPKDALLVAGIHTGEMRKALAWSAITGSSLLDEMRRAGGDRAPGMLKDAEQSGIDFSSTLYFYTRKDTRHAGGTRVAAVLPVSDAKKVTAYLQKHAPGTAISSIGGRSEAMIGGKMYIGWDEDVLIAMNPVVQKIPPPEAGLTDTAGTDPLGGRANPRTTETPDALASRAEMEAAFHPAKDAGIADNARFKDLQNNGHDITIWLAHDAMMDGYGGQGDMGLMGMTMGNALWKGSALATGFDFEKGRLDAVMRYYAADSMRDVMKELGREDVDGDMIRRMPAAGLNFAAGYHIAPKGLRMMLDKMGLSGIANLALLQKGLNIDDILGAFTGDMALSLNNFRVTTTMQQPDSAMQAFGMTPYPLSTPGMDFLFAMKIGDRARFDKLIGFITASGMLQQTAPNTYSMPGRTAGPAVVVGDKYLVASASAPAGQAFLKGPSGSVPDAVMTQLKGHPLGMWADVRSFMSGAVGLGRGAADSAALAAMRNIFTTFTAHGGEFSGKASEYELSLGFANKDENSLVQLLHLAQQLAAARNQPAVARR